MSAWLSRRDTCTGPKEDRYRGFSHLFSSSSDDIVVATEPYGDVYHDVNAGLLTASSKARRIVRRGRDSLTTHRRSHSYSGSKTDTHTTHAACPSVDTCSMTAMHEAKDERVTVGSMNLTVSMLQGPQNHAIWRARLLAALNAEDEALYSAATGGLPLHIDDHAPDADTAQQAAADERDMEQRRRAHIRCVAFITSTLPDSVYAMVMHHTNDACKLIESLDTRFRPYPRYAGGVAAQSTGR